MITAEKLKQTEGVHQPVARYRPRHKVRIVTAASLFDGHDAAINIMRRIMQDTGAEVIHLGHNRSVKEIVDAAIQEDAQAVACTSYQGGHMEFFKYLYDMLHERGAGHIKVFGGGGGTILPEEAEALHRYGIARIYLPDDGRVMGLQGMINDLIEKADFPTVRSIENINFDALKAGDPLHLAHAITYAETRPDDKFDLFRSYLDHHAADKDVPVVGFTGTGGAGKSSLVDELVRRYLNTFPDQRIAIISVDPTRRRSGGALLGDRIRMNALWDERTYMRSMATRSAERSLSPYVKEAIDAAKLAGYDLIFLESSGIGQGDTAIVDYCDVAVYVMTPEYGAPSQLEKIDMLDYADVVVINKFDKKGAMDALTQVRKQFQRNHGLFHVPAEQLPVVPTIASQFNDPGTNNLFKLLMETVESKTGRAFPVPYDYVDKLPTREALIPAERTGYLGEIVDNNRRYGQWAREQAQIASKLYALHTTIETLESDAGNAPLVEALRAQYAELEKRLDPENLRKLRTWPEVVEKYRQDELVYYVRGKERQAPLVHESLSGLKIRKVALPAYRDWGDILYWLLMENVPGEFPYAAGVFPLKRTDEDPTRMFAGEGTPERTNRRFHYVSQGQPFSRLSTAFDSVTLYGENPSERPDIYGKIGNSGVSIATVDDAKKLYSGFDLADPRTSVSMTINGPAPMMLAFFLNAAIDQQCEKYIRAEGLTETVERKIEAIYRKKGVPRPRYAGELPPGNDGLGLMLLGISGDEVLPPEVYERIKADTLSKVRGTVQADILKEDQAQNTCIFSIEFSLRLMGDVQQYFIDHNVKNFYSVSISGYHIAEAGANPITQLAFTLANAFTYVEYYLARGMDINDFARNFSFFFSNGMDPEYSVIGRVARRIWAKAIKYKYGGDERAQKLKYHIQTSGRSLHAQEIAFNDIRTTLQALYAIYDNCNSLHTNAYDEAITTPTEESVRRAMAIQLIINRELGLAKNENPIQGSFIIEELTDLVEEAVYAEFLRINERGGVLGAMEHGYQRSKIQEESMYYEMMKNTGKLPIVGVNTFIGKDGSPTTVPGEVVRSTEAEKHQQIENLQAFEARNREAAAAALERLEAAALRKRNIFAALMEAAKVCSLGQLTHRMYRVGGQYRRTM